MLSTPPCISLCIGFDAASKNDKPRTNGRHRFKTLSTVLMGLFMFGSAYADESVLSKDAQALFSEKLHLAFTEIKQSKKDKIDVIMEIPFVPEHVDITSIGGAMSINATYSVDERGNETYTLNGQKTTQDVLQEQKNKLKDKIDQQEKERRKWHRQYLKEIAQRAKMQDNAQIKEAIKTGEGFVYLSLTPEEIITLANSSHDLIRQLDLHQKAEETSLATSMKATEIDPVATTRNTARGMDINGNRTRVFVGEPNFCPTKQTLSSLTNATYTAYNESDLYQYFKQANIGEEYLNRTFQYDHEGQYFHSNRLFTVHPNENNTSLSAHSSIIMNILTNISPKADLTCSGLFDTNTSTYPTGYDIESYSIGSNTDSDKVYNANSKRLDQHIYATREVVFVGAGNTGSLTGDNRAVTSPGKAMNAITVGNYNDNDNYSHTSKNFSIHTTSSFLDPVTGNQKPEISAPGTNITTQMTLFDKLEKASMQGSGTWTYNLQTTYTASNSFGTSLATPHAAGFLANAMSYTPFLKDSASMAKAFMLSAASDTVSGDQDAIGVGGINFYTAPYRTMNLAYWYDTSSSGPFQSSTNSGHVATYNNKRCFNNWQANLFPRNEAQIVINWFNNPDTIDTRQNYASGQKLPMDYDLYLVNGTTISSSTIVASSLSRANPYEVIKYTYTPSNPNDTNPKLYTLFVCEHAVRDSSAFDMGLAVSFKRP